LNPPHHSADVCIYLVANGSRIEVAGCLDNTCTLRQPQALPPCEAELVVIIDGVERRRIVRLEQGISEDSREVTFLPAPSAAVRS